MNHFESSQVASLSGPGVTGSKIIVSLFAPIKRLCTNSIKAHFCKLLEKMVQQICLENVTNKNIDRIFCFSLNINEI